VRFPVAVVGGFAVGMVVAMVVVDVAVRVPMLNAVGMAMDV
jgi:hypothetical protein